MKSHINCYIPNLITNDDRTLLYHTAKICHLEIPYSFYVVNYTNNKLVINSTKIIVPVGNYNATTLLDKLNLLFSEYGLSSFVLSFNSITGKYTLQANIYFSISSSSTIQDIIGLDEFTYNSMFDITTNKYILEMPYLANTSGSKNIYIRTNIITSNLNVVNNDANIIKSVPVDVPPFGIIQYSNNQGIETLIKNRELNNLEIELLDDNLNYINFNNIEWAICLEIKTVYQLRELVVPLLPHT
jgi:hypothetical protein